MAHASARPEIAWADRPARKRDRPPLAAASERLTLHVRTKCVRKRRQCRNLLPKTVSHQGRQHKDKDSKRGQKNDSRETALRELTHAPSKPRCTTR